MTHTLVGAVGVPGYALFALVTTLPAALPITDLGGGAAIVDAVARDRSARRALVCGTVLSAARNLMCAGALIATMGVTMTVLGLWKWVLGDVTQPGSGVACAIASLLFGFSMPLGLGSSLLTAVNRTPAALLLRAAASILLLALVLVVAALDAPCEAFVATFFFSQCVVGVVSIVLASRYLRLPLLRIIMGSARGRARKDRVRIGQLAVPMAIVTAATAVAYATDRLVLSHTADAAAVAEYSAGAQFFLAASSLLGAAGLPLWAIFARRRRSSGKPRRDLFRLTTCFAVGGLVVGALMIALGPGVGSWTMHGRIQVGTDLMASFAALLFVQAVGYPATMWLTDAAGLRFQATAFSLMAVVNVAVSIPLAQLGAAGPVIGSVLAYAAFVLAPALFRSFRRGDAMPYQSCDFH
ncbi:lipopolysaccharide biosynthesis protein [Streptomyces canus]|uniref:lipopolysaccharide biosynthesis protein n=1 Tax=Streptomyces canus TaxID=58343 RepID=UPI0027D78425|nr:oligosaccharide flippase family protein [Streptomyces canus]